MGFILVNFFSNLPGHPDTETIFRKFTVLTNLKFRQGLLLQRAEQEAQRLLEQVLHKIPTLVLKYLGFLFSICMCLF
jgi:ABC-type branched-subunit amino acid transport system ATPase component